jgi:hypothetical protein
MKNQFLACLELAMFLFEIIYFFIVSIPVFLITFAGAITVMTIKDGCYIVRKHLFQRER